MNYDDKTGNAKAWQQLGFKYSNSKADKNRKSKGLPPKSYAEWLKSGERRSVKGVSITKAGVTKTLIAITYIPKNRAANYYYHNLGGDYSIFEMIVSAVNLKKPKISYSFPKNLIILINVAYFITKIVGYADNKSFKKEMEKGKGVAIIEVRIWSSTAGGSVATGYRSWDGKGDLYEML